MATTNPTPGDDWSGGFVGSGWPTTNRKVTSPIGGAAQHQRARSEHNTIHRQQHAHCAIASSPAILKTALTDIWVNLPKGLQDDGVDSAEPRIYRKQ